MIDIATKYNRSVFGINIAFAENEKPHIRTIGMTPLRMTHTGDNLVQVIKDKLAEYKIVLGQILSLTSDNGKNMIKTIALLDDFYQTQKHIQNEEADLANQTNNEGIPSTESDIEDEEEIDDGIFDADYYADLLSNVPASFGDDIHTDIIHGVSCACHCLHLVVTKAKSKCSEAVILIDKCREFVKKLRTLKFIKTPGGSILIIC